MPTPHPDPDPIAVSIPEVARRLQISYAHVRKLVKGGAFPNAADVAITGNRVQLRIPLTDVHAFLADHKVGGAA